LKNDTQFVASTCVIFLGGGGGVEAGHVARGGEKVGGCWVLVGQLRDSDDLEKHRHRWEGNI